MMDAYTDIMINRRDAEIQKWCQKHRPDLIKYINPKGDRDLDDVFGCLLAIGFEAGRQFQADNLKTELNNPNVYMS